jgi:hypothetical protein
MITSAQRPPGQKRRQTDTEILPMTTTFYLILTPKNRVGQNWFKIGSKFNFELVQKGGSKYPSPFGGGRGLF